MRICVDIQAAVAQRAGVGRYTRNLVEHLAPLVASPDELRLFFFDFHRRGLDFACPGAKEVPVRWLPGMFVQQAWKRLHWPPFDWFSGKADLYHFPNFTIPPLTRKKAVVTIHDMSFFRHPDFAEAKNLAYLNKVIHQTAKRADAILTISTFSKTEIENCLQIPSERVFAVPLGIAPEYVRPADSTIAAFRQEANLHRPYLLSVGTLEPRKNIPFMIEVFERLEDFDGDLVIAGMPGWKFEPILKRMQESPKHDRIRYLQFVPDTLLPSLYAGAELFLTTSHYEGFGFPPLEAMACGTPVISSTGGSLPEILGEAAQLIPVFETEPWVAAIQAALTDPARRRTMATAGRIFASRYSWQKTARQTWDIYRKVLA